SLDRARALHGLDDRRREGPLLLVCPVFARHAGRRGRRSAPVPHAARSRPCSSATSSAAPGRPESVVTAFSPISFWMDHVVGALPALEGDLAVDVAVVGAGLTGLSTALALRREGLSVAVLERDVVGAGASGRNCGQVGAEIGKNLPTLKLH